MAMLFKAAEYIFDRPMCVVSQSCDSMSDGSAADCWYTFWYVWVAFGLFVAVIITILIVYYKHKSKRRNRVQRIGPAMPREPPPYQAPSQEPPAYDDAIKDSIAVPPGFHGDIRHLRAMQIRQRNEENHERQYIQRQLAANRQPSDISIISVPPAYVEPSDPSHIPGVHPPTRHTLNNNNNQHQPPQQGQVLPQRPARLGQTRPTQQQQQQQQTRSQQQTQQPHPAQPSRIPQRPARLGQQPPTQQDNATQSLNVPQQTQPPPRTTRR
ncbi:putative mediator of RNA polymerase II transcription subunit 12 [Ylistrum balloti]|uniref:putative mediator of RNA polymerase II transcription subunit 12 n=1 Tax=Ylistrum balloti TaxID=509963 RepID=UPI002905E597|nr:putative mediator of RNA polymerase II transcription subunit 12 [Ylistrum balloti]